MDPTIKRTIAELTDQSLAKLQAQYAELFQDRSRSHNRVWLIRRIAWALQARQAGGLSERARTRARILAANADLRTLPPRTNDSTNPPLEASIPLDRRLPPPGSLLIRTYKGKAIQVLILHDGFEFEQERFTSLSAVAKRITGSHLNGFRFFNLENGSHR